MKEQHLKVLEELGFNTEGRDYEDVVSDLIEEHIKLMVEITENNRKLFEKGIRSCYNPTFN